jgi:hypothetical protein
MLAFTRKGKRCGDEMPTPPRTLRGQERRTSLDIGTWREQTEMALTRLSPLRSKFIDFCGGQRRKCFVYLAETGEKSVVKTYLLFL